MHDNKVLSDCIEREVAGTDYICMGEDRAILSEMIDAINSAKGTKVQYLAELDAFHIFGAGEIIANYIDRFVSESVKAYLVPQLVLDNVKDCDKIILRLYSLFQNSNEYIPLPEKPAPAHIYVRYDNAFRSLKSKRIAYDLLDIVSSPRNAFYLPLTVKMLASWKMPELKKFLLIYSAPNGISMRDVGIFENGQTYFPPFSYICRELRFTAINGLRYYPSDETFTALQVCICDSDVDIRSAARKSMKTINSKEQK